MTWLFLTDIATAKTAACPCSPCKCSPCSCGSKSSSSKHHDRDRERHGGSVGVGTTIDLSGVGQRKAEPDPFATSNTSSASGNTVERRTTTHHSASKSDPFANVDLTGPKAKGDHENSTKEAQTDAAK